jgi:hypothetical protein
MMIGVNKKTWKTDQTEKIKKKKKLNCEKKPIKPIRILKKSTGSVRFGFGFTSLKPKKPNRTKTQKNRAKSEKNRAKPVWTSFCSKKPNRTESDRFEPVLVFFKKNLFDYFFL